MAFAASFWGTYSPASMVLSPLTGIEKSLKGGGWRGKWDRSIHGHRIVERTDLLWWGKNKREWDFEKAHAVFASKSWWGWKHCSVLGGQPEHGEIDVRSKAQQQGDCLQKQCEQDWSSDTGEVLSGVKRPEEKTSYSAQKTGCPGNHGAHSPLGNLKYLFGVESGPNCHESALLFQSWKLLGVQSSQQGKETTETITVNFGN